MKIIELNKLVKKIIVIQEKDPQILADSIIQLLSHDWDNVRDYVIILPNRNKFIRQFPKQLCNYMEE